MGIRRYYILWALLCAGGSHVCGQLKHDCHRICAENDAPRKCYYHFTLGLSTRSTPEGRLPVFSINGRSPGPGISVCQNDTIIVDVFNRLPGLESTIHWHGLSQLGTPHMDGVPMITQCSIPPGTTFRYLMKASRAGTCYYHAHSVTQQLDGIYGSLIIHKPDEEVRSDTILFAPRLEKLTSLETDIEVQRKVQELSINIGENNLSEHLEFRKKLRLINAAALNCPLKVKTDKQFKIVAADGFDIKPVELNYVLLYPGERIDVIVKSDEMKNIQVLGFNACAKQRRNILDVATHNDLNTEEREPDFKTFFDLLQGESSVATEADSRFFIPFEETVFEDFNNDVDFKYIMAEEGAYTPSYLSNRNKKLLVPQVMGKSFVYPSSPLLTQMSEVSESILCSLDKKAEKCELNSNGFCECVQIVDLPFNQTLDLFLINTGTASNSTHTFHIHGHFVYVLGMGPLQQLADWTSIDDSNSMLGRVERNLVSPMLKDTVVVPNKGYTAIRLSTNNPGFWMLESTTSEAESAVGWQIILKVQQVDNLWSAPKSFPTCGTLKGPDLIFE